MSLDAIITDILRREGGRPGTIVDHPEDHGGPTNGYGITLSTLSAWLHRQATVDELKALTEKEAREIYRQAYVHDPGFGVIGSDALLGLVVDCAVNHGVTQATKLLQRALGVTDDGIFGLVSQNAARTCNYNRTYLYLCAGRIKLYGRIITKQPNQAIFAEGWLNRVAEFVAAA